MTNACCLGWFTFSFIPSGSDDGTLVWDIFLVFFKYSSRLTAAMAFLTLVKLSRQPAREYQRALKN